VPLRPAGDKTLVDLILLDEDFATIGKPKVVALAAVINQQDIILERVVVGVRCSGMPFEEEKKKDPERSNGAASAVVPPVLHKTTTKTTTTTQNDEQPS
jgi:hypothetical protein